MWNVDLFLVSIFLVPHTVLTLREGDSCLVEGRTGVCKLLYACAYADKLVRIDQRRPTNCGWKGLVEIVCCPLEDLSYTTGVLRDAFKDSENGILASEDMTCRSSGDLPILCCDNQPDPKTAPEPPGCPPLPDFKSSTSRNDLIFRKCLEYQRYLYPCVSTKNNPQLYERPLVCGQNDWGERVAEGSPANETEFPHMALLGCRRDKAGPAWVGGGSLISDRFILTAAHVLSSEYGLLSYALLGTTSRNPRDGVIYNVIMHIAHPRYSKSDKYNDIALLKLDRTVALSEYIRPACLPISGIKLVEGRLVSGWGRTGVDKLPSTTLLKAIVTVFDGSRCEDTLDSQLLSRGWLKETMICAGDANAKGRDTCQGDSGGPLQAYVDDVNCTYVVEGVVSWGPQCGQGNPGVYTRVEPYLPWITSTVWPNEK